MESRPPWLVLTDGSGTLTKRRRQPASFRFALQLRVVVTRVYQTKVLFWEPQQLSLRSAVSDRFAPAHVDRESAFRRLVDVSAV
jgi:hypothetical protein